jgi:DNA-binding Lrp family transcriptional regulator
MTQEGIIRRYSLILDYEKLGYELTVITEIIVSKGKLLDVEKEIAKIPNVSAMYDVTGASDAIAIAKFKNRKTLSEFTKKILSLPHVERTNTHVVLGVVKEDYQLL